MRFTDNSRAAIVFAFFGHPGAGKSTLCRRFGELHGIPATDTDLFMTPAERAAVEDGRYTQAMRLANIRRYCDHIQSLLETQPHVALADGLPNEEARRFLRDQLPDASVVFVLIRAPRALWEERLRARAGSPVTIDVAAADAYIRANWEDVPLSWPHEEVENGTDSGATDAALTALYRRHVASERNHL